MQLPDELLVTIYKNLDAKSQTNVMETCKRNYEIINIDVPPKIHLNDKISKKIFGNLIISGRNFVIVSVKLSKGFDLAENLQSNDFKSVNLLSQFFMKLGSAVRYLTMRLKCMTGLILLKFTPRLQKLSLIYDYYVWDVSDALKCHELPNLTELSIKGRPCSRNTKSTISLRHLMDLNLTKLVLDRTYIEIMGANEGFENCKLNLKTLVVTSFDPDENFESFVKFIKSQNQFKCFK